MLRSIVVALSLALFASSAFADIRATAGSPAPAATEAAPPAIPKKAPKVEVPTSVAVMIAYQRVGHDLLALQDQRGVFDCGDLMPRFRAIKLADALATPASRTATVATLTDLAAQIERLRGIHVEQACLDNPLAAGCQ
ncbi:MAG TPA: hypothetical protein VL326_07295 [Kofleriaceae bacterium]|jgi:hypothetical protein|nr:hypothetical protein [Kofleriaceae bacterium]